MERYIGQDTTDFCIKEMNLVQASDLNNFSTMNRMGMLVISGAMYLLTNSPEQLNSEVPFHGALRRQTHVNESRKYRHQFAIDFSSHMIRHFTDVAKQASSPQKRDVFQVYITLLQQIFTMATIQK